MRRHAPRDDRRERIGGLPPGRAGWVGVTAEGDRLFVEAVLHRCRAGIPWRDLPERPGARRRSAPASPAGPGPAGGRGSSDTSPAGPTTSTRWSTAPSSAPAGTAPGRRRDGIGRRGGRARPGRPEHRAPRRRRRARRPDRPRAPARAGARPRGRRRLAAGPGRGGADRRQGLRRRGAGARAARAGRAAVIPPRAGRESPRPHDREPREARHPVENSFAGLKRHRAIATRHDGRAVPFPSAIHLAATVIWLDRGHALAVSAARPRARPRAGGAGRRGGGAGARRDRLPRAGPVVVRRRAPVHRPGGQGHRLPGRRLRRLRVPARPRPRRPGALPARGLGRRSGASGVGARAARGGLRHQAAAGRPHDRARDRGRGAVRLGGGRQRRSLPPGRRGRTRGARARSRRRCAGPARATCSGSTPRGPSTPGSASRRSPAPPRRSRAASIPPPGGASRPARGRRARGSTTGPAWSRPTSTGPSTTTGAPARGRGACRSAAASPTASSPSSRPGARPGPRSRPWSRSRGGAGRSGTASRPPRPSSGWTTTRPGAGTAGTATSRSSCWPSPCWRSPASTRTRQPPKNLDPARPDTPGLIRWSVQELRRVAVRLAQRRIRPAHVIAWSLWRRAHQAAARRSHLKRTSAAVMPAARGRARATSRAGAGAGSATTLCRARSPPPSCGTRGSGGRGRDRAHVWSRDEVVRVDPERRGVVLPGIADGLEGRPPSWSLEVLGEVAGAHGGEDGSSRGPEVGMAGDLDRRLPDGAAHPPGPAVGPGVAGLGGLVLGAVLATRPVEDGPGPPRGGHVTVRCGRGGRAVVGRHGVDRAGEGGDEPAEEGGPARPGRRLEGRDAGELRYAIRRQGRGGLAFGGPRLATAGGEVAGRGLGGAAAPGGLRPVPGRARGAVPHRAAARGAAGRPGGALPRAAGDVVERR